MRKKGLFLLLGTLAIGSVTFLILLNDIIISVRLNEFKTTLQKIDHDESSMDKVEMLATYEINKKLFEKRMSRNMADSIEQKILSYSSQRKNYKNINHKYEILALPALAVINFNRMVIGKPSLKNRYGSGDNFRELDIAYYYERNYLFEKALTFYQKIVRKKDLNSSMKARILLHMGYCYALVGKTGKARKTYQRIIKDFSQEKVSITAIVLLEYLEGFRLARERVLRGTSSSISKGKDLVNLLAFDQALRILKKAEKDADRENLAAIKYFQARCYSGLGNRKKAAENYLTIITETPASRYAKYSNRKLFSMGRRQGGDNRLIKLSKKLNQRLNDPVLTVIIKKEKINPELPDGIKSNMLEDLSPEIIEKAETLTAPKTEKKESKVLLIIKTNDGNTFRGIFIEENDKTISIETSIGIINVKKERIISKSRE